MFSLTCFNLTFTSSRRMFIVTVLFIALFVHLGRWQIERAYEKKQLLDVAHQQSMLPPILWHAHDTLPKQYQALQLSGYFLPMILLLDNQHHQHQLGYDVISPLCLHDGSVVLIDRGWVKADPQRSILPVLERPTGHIDVVGTAYYPSSKTWVLGANLEEVTRDITRVEVLDTPLISQFLHKSVYPFIIRQNKNDAHGYVRDWAIVSMPPVRHYGYAVQWFAMALVIFIIFIALNLKKTR